MRRATADFVVTPVEAATARTLSRALTSLVIHAQEVEPLRRAASRYAKKHNISFDPAAGLLVRPYPDSFDLVPLRNFGLSLDTYESPTAEELRIQQEYFGEGGSPKATPISEFQDALRSRLSALIGLLQDNRIAGWGHTADGHLTLISNGIWAGQSYYIRIETGDVIHVDDDQKPTVWWSAVVLLFPGDRPDTVVRQAETASKHTPQEKKAPSKGLELEARRERAYGECYEWLLGMMAASPKSKTSTKRQLREKAGANWPYLSDERFNEAWSTAARDAKAPVWRRAGRLNN